MSGSARSRNHRREALRRAVNLVYEFLARSSAARVRRRVFSLDFRLTWMSAIRKLDRVARLIAVDPSAAFAHSFTRKKLGAN